MTSTLVLPWLDGDEERRGAAAKVLDEVDGDVAQRQRGAVVALEPVAMPVAAAARRS